MESLAHGVCKVLAYHDVVPIYREVKDFRVYRLGTLSPVRKKRNPRHHSSIDESRKYQRLKREAESVAHRTKLMVNISFSVKTITV
jgi:hypothetical protein